MIKYLSLCLGVILLLGCSDDTGRTNTLDSLATGAKDTATIKNTDDNVVDVSTMSPYKEVDSLVNLLKIRFNVSAMKELDAMCMQSDGDLAEGFWGIAVDLFNEDIKAVTNYFIHNPKSCLKQNVIEGIGVNMCMYSKNEREVQLVQEETRIINMAEREGLSANEINYIRKMFKKVNPNILD